MLDSIENRDDLEELNELASLQSQPKALRLQDKLENRTFMKKVFAPVTETIKDTSQDVTQAMMKTSKGNNKAQANLNDKLLEILNTRGI